MLKPASGPGLRSGCASALRVTTGRSHPFERETPLGEVYSYPGATSMIQLLRVVAVGLAALLLVSVMPLTATAQGRTASSACPPATRHALPKGSGTTTAVKFGVKGGSLRPWSVTLGLGGAISASGTTSTRQQLVDPANTLNGVLTLADAVGFFSMKKTVGCTPAAGNPDVSTRFISIHTSRGTKSVQELGSCSATAKFDQLYGVLQCSAGIG